ncbi:MAG TPA: hypothetical protein VHK91_09600, partial [Flavisolibacter sp.]|nr:hypothetical protein [Flavisolibacter sp.]
MKKIKWPVMALVVGCLVTYACQKSKETKSEPAAVQPLQKAVASAEILTPQSVFTKNVGRPVPRDTCMMWIGQYEKSSLAATGTRCSFKASDLAALLKYKD